jgi:hypothetical protein
MKKKKKNIIIGAVIVLVAVVVITIISLHSKNKDQGIWSSKNTVASVAPFNETNSTEFSDPDLGFSFRYPNSMKVNTIDQDPEDKEAGKVILVQDAEKGQGFQITITPFDDEEGQADSYILTKEQIKTDLPDLKISDVQPVLIGNNGQGLAFRSDNEDFAHDSREVWFVFRGNLYQISTYAYLDPLLQAMFSTWKFQ